MSAPMVRAILDGRKTQTRRVANTGFYAIDENVHGQATATREREKLLSRCPHGVPGDRLWVRETYTMAQRIMSLAYTPCYRADEGVTENNTMPDGKFPWKWTPAIHMRREHSRITLEVTGVRLERVRKISEEDAKAEGIVEPARGFPFGPGPRAYAGLYSDLWDSLNGARGFGWDKNPFVWVLEFKRI